MAFPCFGQHPGLLAFGGRRNSRSLPGLCLFLQLKVPTTDKPTVTVNFRKLLLNRCQKEFEKDKDDDEIFEKRQKEMDDASAVSWGGGAAAGGCRGVPGGWGL